MNLFLIMYKNQLKCITWLNLRLEIMKILYGKMLQDMGMGKNLLNLVPETKHENKNRKISIRS